MKKVSVITPVFNNEKTIRRCIRSIQNQSYPYIEHIIVDGASTDSTLDIIKNEISNLNLVHRKIILISEKDKGIYSAINKGINLSTGEIIGLLNSDDQYYSGDSLNKILTSFNDPKIDMVYGDLIYTNELNTDVVTRTWKPNLFKRSKLHFGWMPPHPTVYIKKEIHKKTGEYNEDFRISGDYDYLLRLLKNPYLKVHYINEILVKMSEGGVSNKSLSNRLKSKVEDLQALKNNSFWFPIFPLIMKTLRKLPQFIIKNGKTNF